MMSDPAVQQLTLLQTRRFSIRLVEVWDGSTGKAEHIPVRRIRGLALVERSDFIKHIESQHTTDRLVSSGQLTSFHANGTPKKRRNGKLPNNKTFYCLKQWSDIDYNQITLSTK